MPLTERIESDLKAALKASERLRLSTLRLIKATLKNKEIEKGSALNDDEVIGLLSSLAKQRKESIAEFRKGGRTDLVEKEESELRIIQEYLPEELSTEEIDRLIQETITEVSASSPSDIGRVMKAIMPKVRGRADGRVVNERVRAALS